MTQQAAGSQTESGDGESGGHHSGGRLSVGRLSGGRLSGVRVTAVLAVVAAIGIVIWLAVGGGSGTSPSSSSVHARSQHGASGPQIKPFPPHTTTAAATAQQLVTAVHHLQLLVFWRGAEPQSAYALTETSQHWVYVSYLPPGSTLKFIHEFPFVATFPVADAYAATLSAARGRSSVRIPAPAGAVAFYYRQYPTSVYFAFRGSHEQIEVFDPVAKQVRALIASGQIRPVGAGRL